jgi:O-antigen/teichoic acid export membrane protein
MNTENNKRIAKNTLLLYFRMMLIMVVSLYTVRVVLNTLGVIDFGIYNVVGGVVVMFSFLSNTMASASQRFFAFDIGRNDMPQLKRTFSMTVIIYFIIAVVILLLAETVGLWFLNTKMVIPADRMIAANWIYQFSILSFLVTILTIPFNAIIIARENMSVYAYVAIVEVILKLVILYFITISSLDKLKLYSVLIFISSSTISLIYVVVCYNKFKESRFYFYWNKELFKSMFGYSSWMLMGSITSILSNQGMNILINIFFGPTVNASRAIAYQVNTAISSFSSNFYTSVRPQIVKAYAGGNNNYMINLVMQSSKFSFYLLLLVTMPILLETKFILDLWIEEATESMVIFTQLIIVFSLVTSLENPLSALVQATGNVKRYEILIGCFTLLSLPISYFFFKWGYAPETSIYVLIFMNIFVHFLRVKVVYELVGMSIKSYTVNVLCIIVLVSLLASIIPLAFIYYLNEDDVYRFIIVSVSSVFSVLFFGYIIGLNKEEQKIILDFIRTKLKY